MRGGSHAQGAEAGKKLAAHQMHAVRKLRHVRPQASLYMHEPATGPDQETAVGHRVQADVSDPHVPSLAVGYSWGRDYW